MTNLTFSSLSHNAFDLAELPHRLRPYYSNFLGRKSTSSQESVKRILLTGHSHQAWPNVARDGVIAAFEDAARHVDDKWGAVFDRAEYVREEIALLTDTDSGEIALAQNTHELFTRFLSALPLKKRPVIVATDGEFHSVYRQLCAAEQAGLLEVIWVKSEPSGLLAERLSDALKKADHRCAAVVTSSVLFQSAALVKHLPELAQECLQHGARLFIDAYHSFKVVPLSLNGFGEAKKVTYLSGGGYKYAQWGEGVCWLRVPDDDVIKPIFTGWFSDFAHLHHPRYNEQGQANSIAYGMRGAERFAGSTFDPSSIYRAASVIQFFREQKLDIGTLRAISLRQTQLLIDGLSNIFPVITPLSADERGGFVAFKVDNAQAWSESLRQYQVFTDARGSALRFGPAPYLFESEIQEAITRTIELHQERQCR